MYHRSGAFTGLITVLFLTLAGQAAGQNFTFKPSLTLGERYDSNARFVDDSMKRDRSDFISTAAPQLILTRDGKRYDLNSLYRMEANHHSRNPELNNISHWLTLDLDIAATARTVLHLGDTARYTKDSIRATDTELLVTRTDILSNTAYAGFTRQMTRNTDMELTLRDNMLEFDAPELIDTRTDSADLSAGYRYSEAGTVRLKYIFSNYSFDTPDDKNIKSHSAQLSVTEKLSQDLSLNIGGGATYIPELDGGEDYFFVANAGFEKAYKDTVLTLQYTREITVPSGLVDEVNLRDRVDAVIQQTISKTITVSVLGGFAKNRTEPSNRVDVNSYIAEAEATWLPYRWLQLGAGISHYQQWRSDDLGTNLTRNQAFINVTFISDDWRF